MERVLPNFNTENTVLVLN